MLYDGLGYLVALTGLFISKTQGILVITSIFSCQYPQFDPVQPNSRYSGKSYLVDLPIFK